MDSPSGIVRPNIWALGPHKSHVLLWKCARGSRSACIKILTDLCQPSTCSMQNDTKCLETWHSGTEGWNKINDCHKIVQCHLFAECSRYLQVGRGKLLNILHTYCVIGQMFSFHVCRLHVRCIRFAFQNLWHLWRLMGWVERALQSPRLERNHVAESASRPWEPAKSC